MRFETREIKQCLFLEYYISGDITKLERSRIIFSLRVGMYGLERKWFLKRLSGNDS